jgi:hypothetical protein
MFHQIPASYLTIQALTAMLLHLGRVAIFDAAFRTKHAKKPCATPKQ